MGHTGRNIIGIRLETQVALVSGLKNGLRRQDLIQIALITSRLTLGELYNLDDPISSSEQWE